MAWNLAARAEREHNVGAADQRREFERDRDRILYSSAFHRLSGVTQIVRAGEADYFHTRQQHTLKVAQLGRRLAQHCATAQEALANTWGIDAEVVEAACLAHDLGHPPFGHIGEYTLDELVRNHGVDEGFEGNAQSFRIITKIGVRYDEYPGLDLTRATMAAVLKYPWLRNPTEPGKSKKWAAYGSEQLSFEFARKYHSHEKQTAEAALMDWADDIAYSVHDLEDFHRAGVIPWREIFSEDGGEDLIRRTENKWYDKPADAYERLRVAWTNLREYFAAWDILTTELYDGSRYHRIALRSLTSTLISRYVQATRLSGNFDDSPIIRGAEEEAEVLILKQITRKYIISSPTLLAQQHGQRRIIAKLFKAIADGVEKNLGVPPFLPTRLHYLWDYAEGERARFAADCISSLSEVQATALFARLYGTAAGSVLDPIVR
ncbi:deoxyguanosinetriphosphate triphosphohydrolase family protein [Sphingosinicella sp. CPCC 101087]|uniref:deoxyguanosinetriphosphate triphosphohydrolase family protein n=1 Tax=Sphingosinicella sp. CPCC 101087 TaxID=2497754 RepID=UPI00101DA2D4|nr:dNTP triphosphohydrolase [Sphingosinicella sp. CPCC 101087]